MNRSFYFPRKRLLLACVGISVACLAALGANTMDKTALDPAVVAADPQVKQVTAANTDFGFRLLAQLNRDSQGKNIFFSPLSVSDALTMTLNGAGGATEQTISKTLGMQGLSRDETNHAYGLLLPSLTNPDPQVELSVANALWANKGVTFAPDFQERCRRFYEARTETLDFGSPSAADTINGWVSDNTHGKIEKLVSAGDLAQSPAVLTNAVYFHGQWSKQFNKGATQDGPFTLEDGSTKTLPLMSQTGSYSYLETSQFQAVSLPYGTGRMSLYVFLPKPGTSLDTFISPFNSQSWQENIAQMHPASLTIILPRFKAEYKTRLLPDRYHRTIRPSES